jgi:hypothetical protein
MNIRIIQTIRKFAVIRDPNSVEQQTIGHLTKSCMNPKGLREQVFE